MSLRQEFVLGGQLVVLRFFLKVLLGQVTELGFKRLFFLLELVAGLLLLFEKVFSLLGLHAGSFTIHIELGEVLEPLLSS